MYRVGNDVVIRNDDHTIPKSPTSEAVVDPLLKLIYCRGRAVIVIYEDTYTLNELPASSVDQDNTIYYSIRYIKGEQPDKYRDVALFLRANRDFVYDRDL